MGNSIRKTNLYPGDSNVRFVISTKDGRDSYFKFSFFRNSIQSKPAFILFLGAKSNKKMIMQKIDENTGKIINNESIVDFSISSMNVEYDFDICKEKISILQNDIVLGDYTHPDFKLMTQYTGDGSKNTIVFETATMHSQILKNSFLPLKVLYSKQISEFPWWEILLIIIGSLIVIGYIIWILYIFIISEIKNI